MSDGQRTTGTIKWFSGEKGYGFVQADGIPTDIFLHVKALRASGIMGTLVYGQPVAFICNTGPKGLFATNITCSEPPTGTDNGTQTQDGTSQAVQGA